MCTTLQLARRRLPTATQQKAALNGGPSWTLIVQSSAYDDLPKFVPEKYGTDTETSTIGNAALDQAINLIDFHPSGEDHSADDFADEVAGSEDTDDSILMEDLILTNKINTATRHPSTWPVCRLKRLVDK
jgi:hypothetical protein